MTEVVEMETPEKLLDLLRTFHDVTKLINSELELSSLIDTILSMLIQVMGAQSALILQLNEATKKLRKISSRGEWPLDLSLFDLVQVDHVAHCLVKHGSPINPKEFISGEAYDKATEEEKKNLESIVCAPLEAKGKITGLVCVHAPDRIFNIIDLEMFCSLASQAALAIENAALYERLKAKLTLTSEELKHTHAQLIRSEKMSSLVEMAMGVAHSIRNPVMTIGGFARLAARDLEANPAAKEKLDYIIEDAARLENIVKEFEQFAKRDDLMLELMDIVPIIRQSVEKTKKLPSAHGVRFRFVPKVEVLRCWMDPVFIRKALDELLLNASEAVKEEGVVNIAVEQEEHYLRIDIADTGKGISSENISKIFDPFFSTKTQSLGLGLTYVHRIIEDHEGTIEVASESSKGTSFIIRIPMALYS